MPEGESIPGGYILLARKLLDSEIMNKPPHYLKLWVWMLGKAFWKKGDKLRRGQFLTTIAEMQEVGGYRVGYRKIKLTRDEVRGAYEHFTKATMITTTKTTRGMVISILNYEHYQNPDNYEPHNEPHNGDTTNPIRQMKKEKKEELKSLSLKEAQELFTTYYGRIHPSQPEIAAMRSMCETYTREKIENAFLLAGAAKATNLAYVVKILQNDAITPQVQSPTLSEAEELAELRAKGVSV